MNTHHQFKAILREKGKDLTFDVKWNTNKTYLTVRSDDKSSSFRLYLDDILDIQAYNDHLDILAYPLFKEKRERKLYSLRCDELPGLEKILKAHAAFPTPPHRPTQKAIEEKRFLVLLNPFSGQKKADALWAKLIRPLFDEMHITCKVIRTERSGHAIEIIQNLDIENYVAVGVLSGDGMVWEILNGLLKRPDYKRALKFPIIHLPTGTSNALGAAIAYQSREPFSPRDVFCKEIALMCAKPAFRALRLYHVQTAENGEFPMFMTAGWGLMADIDLGSERFRWMGMIRLHIEAFIRIAGLPQSTKYNGRISYKLVEDKQVLRNTLIKANDAIEKLGKEHFCKSKIVEFVDSNEILDNEECTIESAFRGTQSVADKNGKIPQLNQPVPADWTVIEGEFVYACLSSLSHLGSDLPYIPSATLDEEVFYLTLIDWRALKSRLHMAHLLLTIENCNHLQHTCLHIIPVTACRVESMENVARGYVAIDGEPCSSGKPFQVFSTTLQATVIGRELRE